MTVVRRCNHLGRGTEAQVRLLLAVTRGLLLDLAATDDEQGVDEAAEVFVELLRRAAPRVG